MYKKLLTALMILSVPLISLAAPSKQGDSGWSDKARRLELLTKSLGLNEEQKAKVETIFDEEKLKLKALHQETRVRLQDVLSKEQMAKFEELHQQRRHKQLAVGAAGKVQQ